jgi:hypothetical protein
VFPFGEYCGQEVQSLSLFVVAVYEQFVYVFGGLSDQVEQFECGCAVGAEEQTDVPHEETAQFVLLALWKEGAFFRQFLYLVMDLRGEVEETIRSVVTEVVFEGGCVILIDFVQQVSDLSVFKG